MIRTLELHEAIREVEREALDALDPEERRDPEMVARAIRYEWRRGPRRPAGSADQYGVPSAET